MTKEELMLEEYDFTGGVRGKYVDRIANRKNVIALEPNKAEVFTDSDPIDEALQEPSQKNRLIKS